MLTYSEQEVFSENDLSNYRLANKIVDMLPDRDSNGELLRCHEVARVVGRLLDLPVRDGKYELGAEHSWLELPSRHLLDVYCVGRFPPVQLVARVLTMPVRHVERDIELDVRKDVVTSLWRTLVTKLGKQDGQSDRIG